jgi:hypothetical protein
MRAEEVCARGLPQTQFLTEFAEIVMNISCSVLLLTSFRRDAAIAKCVCVRMMNSETHQSGTVHRITARSAIVAHEQSIRDLPPQMSNYVWQRLWDILSGNDDSSKFEDLSIEDRVAIIEIIRNTKQGLPKYWLNAPVARISDRQDWWSPEN